MTRMVRATLGALVLALAGCGGGVNIAEIDARSKQFNLVAINDGGLQSDAEIVGGKALYQEQLMQALVEVQSHENDSQKLYYKWNWQDQDGFPLKEEPWQFLVLNGNERKLLTGTASAPRAERCQFLLRRPNTKDGEKK